MHNRKNSMPPSDQVLPPLNNQPATTLPVGKFSRSREMLKQSLRVLKLDKELALFPVVSAITSMVLLSVVGVAAFLVLGQTNGADTKISGPAEIVVLFVVYFVTYAVSVFFNAGLVAAAIERFQGGDPTFGSGMRAASRRLPAILAYAAIAATVGVILRLISERSNIVGRILIAIVGFAWSLAVIFIAPVLVMKQLGPIESIKESANTFKRVWGEDVIGSFSITLALIPLTLLAIVPAIASFFLVQTSVWFLLAGIVISALALLALMIVGSTCQSIFNAALYLYATSGQAPAVYEKGLVENAFTRK
jgi:hypothetical protein